jgi:hypothetical protein
VRMQRENACTEARIHGCADARMRGSTDVVAETMTATRALVNARAQRRMQGRTTAASAGRRPVLLWVSAIMMCAGVWLEIGMWRVAYFI